MSTSTIDIKNLSGAVIVSALTTEDAISHEELMNSDYVQLSWNSDTGDTLPAGAYIMHGTEKYSLLEPYTPTRADEAEYQYTPQFQSRIMGWQKHPVPIYTYADDGTTVESREFDWEFTGSPADAMYMVQQAIKNETGESWTVQLADSLPATISISSQSGSIFSVLNDIANQCETEWWGDKATNTLYLSQCKHGTAIPLSVGGNVKAPSVTSSKDGYFTRFYVFGSSRNVTQDISQGAVTNSIINRRLTLDPATYPGGYIDVRPDLQPGEIFTTTLYYDDIYPSSKLAISDVRARLKYRLDSNGNKIQTGADDEGNPVYEQYAIWYFQIADFSFDPETIIEGMNLSVSFETGQLAGRDFELAYHEKAETVNDGADVVPFNILAGDYEIILDESTGTIIPGLAYIIPQEGDQVILYNIEMPAEYTASARQELAETAQKDIAKRMADNNSYEFDSNPVDFYENDTDLTLGQAVTFSNGEMSLSTRVLMVEKHLDSPCRQRIRVGNEIIKGNTQQLREEVTQASQNIDILAAFNELSTSLQNTYGKYQREMAAWVARINGMWRFDPNDPSAIYSDYGVYSNSFISAKGKEDESGAIPSGATKLSELTDVSLSTPSNGQALVYDLTTQKWVNKTIETGGIDEEELAAYLTTNNYAKKSDIPALTGYATQEWVNTKLGSYATTSAMNSALGNKVDKVAGKGLSSNDFTDALLEKLNGIEEGANKYVLPTATGSVIGGVKVGATLAIASGVLNMKAVGTAGTYTKVTVDAYGRVTGHSSLAATDIPSLDWSKITSGKPTTLAGYGITDGVNDVSVTGNGNIISAASVSGHTLTLTKGITAVTTSRTVTAGAGLTGGGALSANITLNVVSANAGITVNADNIQLNTINVLTSTDTVKPLSAAQGKVIWDFITDLFEKVNIGTSSAPVWAIRAKYGLYTESFLSAKGANPDSGGTVVGVTALSELTDVSITPETLSNNDMLRWNGSKWVAVAMSDITPDLSGYATQSWVTSQGYLKSVSLATISDLHSSWDAVLKAQKPAWLTSVSLATISDLHASWDALLKAAPSVYVTRWPTASEVGALTQTSADARYLLKSAYTAADVLAKLKTVDGSGSGIDADLLDGYHISNIETGGWTSFVTYIYDATNGTRNYCYRIGNLNNSGDVILRIRVVDDINYPSYSEWTLRMAYNSSYVPVVSLVPNTTCRNTLTVYVDTSKYLWIKCNAAWNSSMQYKIEHNTGNILITSNPSRVETSPSNVSYTFSNFGSTRDGVANGSYYHWSSVYVGALSGNATSATKLLTARTINGTSFDGTANITTSKWGTARTLTLTGAVTGSVSIDGSGNVSLATTYSTGSAGPLDGRYALIGGSNATGTWPISITGSSARITSTVYNSGSLASLTTAGRLYHAGGGNTVTDKPSGVDAFGLFTMRTAAGWQGQILMSANTATGLYWRTANNNFNGGWRTILDSSNYTSTLDNRYVTLSTTQTISGAKTFSANTYHRGYFYFDYDSDSSRVYSIYFRNTSKETMGMIGYHNTEQNFFINPISSDSPWMDAVGKYSLFVGNNKLTYNTYPILHSNNYTSYTVTKTGGGASGTWPINITGNADTLDGRQGTSYGIMWGGMNTATDPGADDTTSTSITDFLTRLNYSGIFGSRFGAMRGSWYHVGNTQYNTGVGTLEMAGTAVLNMSYFADTSANYKTLLFLEGGTGNMYSYVSQRSGTARWSRYARTIDNVASATKLATARQINGTAFNGTANITTAKWGTARSIYIRDASQAHTGAAVSVDGSANEYLLLPSTITATLSGNASTASKWATARTLTLTGAVTGSVSIDGSGNVSMATTYATGNISALDSRYVNISGDTMTGNLTATSFTASSNAFTLGDTVYTNGRLAFVDGALWLQSSQNGKIQISGRNGSDLTDFNVKVSSHSVATINDSVIWTAGNDGSGSGLDADLLDGTHKTGLLTSVTSSSTTNLSVAVGGTTKSVADLYATYLDGVTLAGLRGLGYAMQSTTIDASSLDEDTWYPVTIKLDARDLVLIALIVSLDSGTKPSWSTHTGGFSVRKVWYSNGSGWGTNAINRVVLFSDYSFTDTDPVRGIGQMSYSSNEYVYVRGGGKYHFYTSHAKRTITLHSSTYTVNGQSVSPTTTAPAAIVRNNAYTTDNVASATKLQTARTIWGQSFNGTAPVSGNMTGVGSISASGNITTDNALFQIDATNISGDRGLNVLYNGQRVLCGFGTSGSKGLFITHSGSSPGWVLSVPSSTVLAIAQNSGINVGIGTTSPSYKLHVAGTGYFSGTLSTSSSIIANSYIYSNEGWFQNKKADTGLYNSVVDARWYATSGGWISDKKINATAGLAVTGGASVSGDLTIGLTSLILRTGSSTSWINGRDGALVRNTTYKGYNAIISAKTTNGSWLLGPYENDLLYFTYTTDANYNAGTNNATYNITLPKKTGTIALTSDIPSITDIVTGNAGSATLGVYVSGSEVKAMTYSLHAHVNSGLTSRLAVYNTNTAISYMNTTVGSLSKPIFISSGVPTACTELNTIPHYGKYYINSREATYSTVIDNYAFIRSIVRLAEGLLLITVNIPVSVIELSQMFVWGVGRYTHIDTSADGGCYVSIYIINSSQMRVTVHDDASANDGYFYLHFLTIG